MKALGEHLAILQAIGGAEVWRINLDAAPPSDAILSEEERRRAGRIAIEVARRRFVAAHAGLRAILAHSTGRAPEDLRFGAGPHGKPFLEGGPRFSLSHSAGLAVCAICADRELGIDLEKARQVAEARAIAERWFDADEQKAFEAERLREPAAAFIRCWVRKEAWLKALGIGFSSGETASPFDPVRWERHDLALEPPWACALVIERLNLKSGAS
jgi:4'-phosphopantetheinyl transferase